MSRDLRRIVRVLLPSAAACLIFGGCTREAQEGDATIFTYALWLPALVVVGGVVGTVVGFMIRKRIARLGWGLVVLGPVATFIFAPCLYADKVTISNDHFRQQTGFWFAPTIHEFEYADLSQVELTKEISVGRRGRTNTNYFMQCHRRTGNMEKVPLNDLMKEGALGKALEVATARGISIIDRR